MAVVVFRAHEDNAFTRRGLAKLRAELPHLPVHVLAYVAKTPAPEGIFADATIVTGQDLAPLPYAQRLARFDPDDLYTACDLPLMKFFHEHPDEDFYWIIEFDVWFSGDWKDLFATLAKSRADLLGTTILRQPDIPEWEHWPSLSMNGAPLAPERCVKAFMPFARLSGVALRTIDRLYTEGLDGHFEAAWPTACLMRGLSVEDIGGQGPFTPKRWIGRHYTNMPRSGHLCPGTFVYRPVFSQLDVDFANMPPMLWHPVKSAGQFR